MVTKVKFSSQEPAVTTPPHDDLETNRKDSGNSSVLNDMLGKMAKNWFVPCNRCIRCPLLLGLVVFAALYGDVVKAQSLQNPYGSNTPRIFLNEDNNTASTRKVDDIQPWNSTRSLRRRQRRPRHRRRHRPRPNRNFCSCPTRSEKSSAPVEKFTIIFEHTIFGNSITAAPDGQQEIIFANSLEKSLQDGSNTLCPVSNIRILSVQVLQSYFNAGRRLQRGGQRITETTEVTGQSNAPPAVDHKKIYGDADTGSQRHMQEVYARRNQRQCSTFNFASALIVNLESSGESLFEDIQLVTTPEVVVTYGTSKPSSLPSSQPTPNDITRFAGSYTGQARFGGVEGTWGGVGTFPLEVLQSGQVTISGNILNGATFDPTTGVLVWSFANNETRGNITFRLSFTSTFFFGDFDNNTVGQSFTGIIVNEESNLDYRGVTLDRDSISKQVNQY